MAANTRGESDLVQSLTNLINKATNRISPSNTDTIRNLYPSTAVKNNDYLTNGSDENNSLTLNTHDRMTSNTDGLSREVSTASTSSSYRNDGNNNSGDDDVSKSSSLSRDSTTLSEGSDIKSRDSKNVSIVSSHTKQHSRESSNASTATRKSGINSRQSTNLSSDDSKDTIHSQKQTRENTLATTDDDQYLSRESTGLSLEVSSRASPVVSRENTGVSNPLEISRENTNYSIEESNNETSYEDDFHESDDDDDDKTSTRENSMLEHRASSMEKENSVLVEKDGKFELVDEKDLTHEEKTMLGMKTKKKQERVPKKQTNARVRKSSNAEGIKSQYAMSEQQKEMKTRRISVMQMRRQEEKERLRKEQGEKEKATEKSYNKWLEAKSSSCKDDPKMRKKSQQELSNKEREEEDKRRQAADKAFQQWLDEKEVRAKADKKLEKIRFHEEAQSYIVRDRRTCDKAFNEWLRKKRVERDKQQAITHSSRKKSYAAPKKKSLATVYANEQPKEQRLKSSVIHDGGNSGNNDKRRTKTSTIRITDNFGYRHPASIDDFISRE